MVSHTWTGGDAGGVVLCRHRAQVVADRSTTGGGVEHTPAGFTIVQYHSIPYKKKNRFFYAKKTGL